jgi:hypothetical protein
MDTGREKCVGVIGCGFRSVELFGYIPNLGEGMKVAAVYDPRVEAM